MEKTVNADQSGIRAAAIQAIPALLAILLFILAPQRLTAAEEVPHSGAGSPGDTIIAVVPEDLPPTYFRDPATGKAAGFAVDVMDEIARLSGLKVKYVFGKPWDEMIEMVRSGRADIIPHLTTSPEREKILDFTVPIEVVPVGLIVTADSKVTGFALGLKVGTLKGSVPEKIMRTKEPEVEVVLYEDMTKVLFSLLAGQIDAAFVLNHNLMKLAYDAGVQDRLKVLSPPVYEAKRGIAVRKDAPGLRERLDSSAGQFIGTPGYASLFTKWYGKPQPYWTAARTAFAMGGILLFAVMALLYWRYLSISRLNRKVSTAADALRATLDSVNDALFIHDLTTGDILDVNRKMCEMYGYTHDEALQLAVEDLSSGEPPYTQADAVSWIKKAADGGPQMFEWHARRKDGSLFWVEVNMRAATIGDEDRVIVMVRDVTERKQLEMELNQAQKMEAIGVLAGGVAHDFNNVLSAITGFASLLQMKLKTDDPLRQYVQPILQSSEKATALTKTLLSFSRKERPEMKPVDANAIISGFQKILTRLIGEDIEFSINVFPEALNVQADKGQIEQVLMNLAANARDAMPSGGKLAVITDRVVFSGEHGDLPPGAYARISVSDTGIGMDKKTQEHIFEPFFTTKEVGKGTGLGLSIVYGIVKNHGGSIHVYSEPGLGTTFKVLLPLLDAAVSEQDIQEQYVLPSGTETILLAEDDEGTRLVAKVLLEEYGYTVIEAVDGEDAIAKFRENMERIHLVLTDLIMPKKNGREAYEEMKRLRPDICAVFMSGYTADIIAQKGIIGEGMSFISKPITPTELLRGVRTALQKTGG